MQMRIPERGRNERMLCKKGGKPQPHPTNEETENNRRKKSQSISPIQCEKEKKKRPQCYVLSIATTITAACTFAAAAFPSLYSSNVSLLILLDKHLIQYAKSALIFLKVQFLTRNVLRLASRCSSRTLATGSRPGHLTHSIGILLQRQGSLIDK